MATTMPSTDAKRRSTTLAEGQAAFEQTTKAAREVLDERRLREAKSERLRQIRDQAKGSELDLKNREKATIIADDTLSPELFERGWAAGIAAVAHERIDALRHLLAMSAL